MTHNKGQNEYYMIQSRITSYHSGLVRPPRTHLLTHSSPSSLSSLNGRPPPLLLAAAALSAPDDLFLPRVPPLECCEGDGPAAGVTAASDATFNDNDEEALLLGPSLGVLNPSADADADADDCDCDCVVGDVIQSLDDAVDEERDRVVVAVPPAAAVSFAGAASPPPVEVLLNPVKKPRALAPVNATPLVVLVTGEAIIDTSMLLEVAVAVVVLLLLLVGAFKNELTADADPDIGPKPESAPDRDPEPSRAFVNLNDPDADRPTVVALPKPRMLDGVP